jgi:hypothetical protein
LLGCAVSIPAAAARPAPVVVDHPGVWTLARLGYGSQVIAGRLDSPVQERTLRFALPPGAHQGRRSWYLIRLHYRVWIDPRSTDGRFYVTAATDGQTSASTRFTLERSDSGLSVVRDDLGLVRGHEVREGRALVQTVRFENYIPYRGIRPRANTLRFGLSRYEGALVRRLEVLPDSALVLTRVGPPRLRISLSLDDSHIFVGERFGLRVAAYNTGRRVGDATFAIEYPANAFRLDGHPQVTVLWPLRGPAETTFLLRGRRPGRLPVVVSASAALAAPEAFTRVHVLPGGGGGPSALLLAGLATAGAVVLALTLLAVRRRVGGRAAFFSRGGGLRRRSTP